MSEEYSSRRELFIQLTERSRACKSVEELAFLGVNDTQLLMPYRQSALWLRDGGVRALSGVVQLEANAPYVQWLQRVCDFLCQKQWQKGVVSYQDLPAELQSEWIDWLPAYALWWPMYCDDGSVVGAFLFASDSPWHDVDEAILAAWFGAWLYAWRALSAEKLTVWNLLRKSLKGIVQYQPELPYWRRRRTWMCAVILVVLLFPIHLSVLAPAEIVPISPLTVRAPIDGVLKDFYVKPNQVVTQGQALFDFEDAPYLSRLEVARQSLAGAEAEYRQQMQQALNDQKAKSQLAISAARIEEKRSELAYVESLVARSKVLSSKAGVVLFDDANDWIGRPVQTGERIMRIADPQQLEIEAWVSVADAIPFPNDAKLSFYVNASPLSSIEARVHYMSHEALQRPDGNFAYRVRASVNAEALQRIGAKGTARLYGERVPLVYWIVRRPLSVIRQTLAW